MDATLVNQSFFDVLEADECCDSPEKSCKSGDVRHNNEQQGAPLHGMDPITVYNTLSTVRLFFSLPIGGAGKPGSFRGPWPIFAILFSWF